MLVIPTNWNLGSNTMNSNIGSDVTPTLTLKHESLNIQEKQNRTNPLPFTTNHIYLDSRLIAHLTLVSKRKSRLPSKKGRRVYPTIL